MGKASNRKKTVSEVLKRAEAIETRGFDLFFNHDRDDPAKMVKVIEKMGEWAKEDKGLKLKGNLTISCTESNSSYHGDAMMFSFLFDEWTSINVIDAMQRLDYIYRFDNANSDNWYSGCEFYTRYPA